MPQIEIGFLCAATNAAWTKYYGAFESALKRTNPNVHITYVSVEADSKGYDGAARYLAGIKDIKVIVTAGTEAALACKRAADPTKTAVVFASAGDPLGCGLVKSLRHPTGTNVTGCINKQTDEGIVKKRIDVMKNKLPPRKIVLVVGNNPPAPGTLCAIDHAMDKALDLLRQARIATATKDKGRWSPSDFLSVDNVKAKLTPLRDEVDVLWVCSDPVVSANVNYLIHAARALGMRTMHEFREHVDAPNNGHQCYGPS